ncbi:MAG: ATP-binding cassette domain-containing protein, partial [Candidatus Macondimonas sp.]
LASGFSFVFREPDAAPNPMLVMEAVDCGYRTAAGPQPIVRGVTLSISNGQRIGLLGANGQGKSTLIKTLAGTLEPLSGSVQAGKGLQIGYFAQHQLETLRPQDSALQHLARQAPGSREQELRNFLGSFNFRSDMATAPIAPFSGGEKARLALALIVWQKPNLLLLDEPTNHLDLETREALTMALAQFEGTLIVVSHDRHLLRATTDQFMLVAGAQLQAFDGDLDDYRNWLLKQAAEKRTASTGAATLTGNTAPAVNRKEQRKAEAEERQRRAQQRKPLQKELDKIEIQMAQLSADKARLDALLSDAALYDEANKSELTRVLREQAEVQTAQARLEARWLELQSAIEAP